MKSKYLNLLFTFAFCIPPPTRHATSRSFGPTNFVPPLKFCSLYYEMPSICNRHALARQGNTFNLISEHADLENKSCTMSIKVCSAERRRSSEEKQTNYNNLLVSSMSYW